jgi:hypothetical protein
MACRSFTPPFRQVEGRLSLLVRVHVGLDFDDAREMAKVRGISFREKVTMLGL